MRELRAACCRAARGASGGSGWPPSSPSPRREKNAGDDEQHRQRDAERAKREFVQGWLVVTRAPSRRDGSVRRLAAQQHFATRTCCRGSPARAAAVPARIQYSARPAAPAVAPAAEQQDGEGQPAGDREDVLVRERERRAEHLLGEHEAARRASASAARSRRRPAGTGSARASAAAARRRRASAREAAVQPPSRARSAAAPAARRRRTAHRRSARRRCARRPTARRRRRSGAALPPASGASAHTRGDGQDHVADRRQLARGARTARATSTVSQATSDSACAKRQVEAVRRERPRARW